MAHNHEVPGSNPGTEGDRMRMDPTPPFRHVALFVAIVIGTVLTWAAIECLGGVC